MISNDPGAPAESQIVRSSITSHGYRACVMPCKAIKIVSAEKKGPRYGTSIFGSKRDGRYWSVRHIAAR